MTSCGPCKLRFTSTTSFDAHRVGDHELDYSATGPTKKEALLSLGLSSLSTWRAALAKAKPAERYKLRLPPSCDGRRCLSVGEMEEAGFVQDSKGCWYVPPSEAARAWF